VQFRRSWTRLSIPQADVFRKGEKRICGRLGSARSVVRVSCSRASREAGSGSIRVTRTFYLGCIAARATSELATWEILPSDAAVGPSILGWAFLEGRMGIAEGGRAASTDLAEKTTWFSFSTGVSALVSCYTLLSERRIGPRWEATRAPSPTPRPKGGRSVPPAASFFFAMVSFPLCDGFLFLCDGFSFSSGLARGDKSRGFGGGAPIRKITLLPLSYPHAAAFRRTRSSFSRFTCRPCRANTRPGNNRHDSNRSPRATA